MLNKRGITASQQELAKLEKEARAVGFRVQETAERADKSAGKMARGFDLVGRSVKQLGSYLLSAFGAVKNQSAGNPREITASQQELAKLEKEARAVGFRVQETAERADKSAGKMARGFDLVGRSVKQLGSYLLSAFGAVAIIQGIGALIAEKLKLRRAIAGLERDLEGLGLATKEQTQQVSGFLTRLRTATGTIETEAIPAIKELTRATKDLGAGLALTQAAAVLSADGFGSIEDVAGSLARLLKGDIPSVAEAFGVDAESAGELRSQVDIANDVLDLLTKKLEAAAAARREALSIEPASTRVDPRTGAVTGDETFRARKEEQEKLLAEFEANEKKIQAGFVAFMEQLFARAAAADKKALDEKAKRDEETAKRIVEKRAAVEFSAAEKLLEAQIAMEGEGSLKRLNLELKLLEDQKQRALALAGDSAKARADIEASFALARMRKEQEVLDFWEEQHEAYLERKRQAGEQLVEDEDRRRAAEAEQDQRLRDLEISQLEEGNEERLALIEEDLMEQMNKESAAAEAEGKDRAKVQLYWLRKIQIARAAHAKAEKKIDKDSAEFKREQMLAGISAALTMGEVLFGESKALAIAQALVNTYASAALALNQPPGAPATIPFAALAIAAGMKQVQAIRKTKKERGGGGGSGEAFDDAVNDEKAFTFGRKSVTDFIEHTSRGHQEALRQVLPALATREGREAAVGRAEMMQVFGDRTERRLAPEIRELVTIIRRNIDAGDATGGVPGTLAAARESDTGASQATARVSPPASGGSPALAAPTAAVMRPPETAPPPPARRGVDGEPTSGQKSLADFIQGAARDHQPALREVLPSLRTRKGRHFMTDRLEGLLGMEFDSGAAFTAARWDAKKGIVIRRKTLERELKQLVQLVRDNINAGDPDGGIVEALEYFRKLDLERRLAEETAKKTEPQGRRERPGDADDTPRPGETDRRRDQAGVVSGLGGRVADAIGGRTGAGTDELPASLLRGLGGKPLAAMARVEVQSQPRSADSVASSLLEKMSSSPAQSRPADGGDREGAVAGDGNVIQHITISNVYGGDAGLRELSRRLERAARLDRTQRMR